MRKLLFILIFNVFTFASITVDNSFEKQLFVLNELGIDPRFINDVGYKKIINNYLNKVGYKKSFLTILQRSKYYIPIIKYIFKQENIPSELLYMAMAESMFSNIAQSQEKAVGLWQFLAETGRLNGLKINSYMDERRDIIKSTEAAARLLKKLKNEFGRWDLVIMAYNAGPSNIRKALRRAKTDDIMVLIDDKKKYLPRQTRNYLRKIIAFAALGSDNNYLGKYSYLANRVASPMLAQLDAPKGVLLKNIARISQINYREFLTYNRHFIQPFTPPYNSTTKIYIPYENLAAFKLNSDKIKPSKTFYVYKVKKGDNLYTIARKFNIHVVAIKDFNQLKSSLIKPKQKLIIPVERKNVQKKYKNIYIVQAGDSLSLIAKKVGHSVRYIKSINNLKHNKIIIGDTLIVSQ